ncbi:BatD family protein [Salegentibacter sediminis]|uniref:BatD family protein n=1 Tax=Salegentibacter sediminis TaxID=1930251 RepID=UPI0009BFD855|nr:BatD family protein [Salegentibacter sediminis]
MKLKYLFISILFLMAAGVQAQVKFEAKVSKNKLGVNERLRVDFEMNKDGDNFRPPSFAGFTVVGGPNQSVSQSFVNGKRSYSKTYSFFLQPKSRGNKTIGQAEIIIDETTYKTSPVDIEVTAAVEKPTDGNDAEIVAAENLHLIAEVSKADPYLNEAVTVVYKLYVSPNISVSDWREVDSPNFTDFWSQNIDIRELRVENGEYKGEPYRYVELRKSILYPQKTGELEIEPLTLSISVDVPGERRDLFGRRLYKTINKTVSSSTRTLDVKPLPEEGKPLSFTGAVGNFSFDVKASKTELDASESLQATVEVKGNGNLNLFELPVLELPSSLEVYDPERSENVNVSLRGQEGTISENYTIVPTQKGKYPIKPVNFSYFNPKTESYHSLSSEEILIDVKRGPAASSIAGRQGGSKAVALPSDQFRYIKLKPNLKPIEQSSFFNSPVFWGSLALPIIAIPLLIFFGRKRLEIAGDEKGKRIKKADRLARKYLSEAKKKLGDQKEFYEALERSLHNYLKAKLHIQTAEMSKEKISAILKEKGINDEDIMAFTNLLKSCEFARYTPASQVSMEQDYDKAVTVISTLDKQL